MGQADHEQLVSELMAGIDKWNRDAGNGPPPTFETRMGEEDIMLLKSDLNEDINLRNEVCTHIVINMLMDREAEEDGSIGSREDFAYESAMLALEYRAVLDHALEFPGGEWPEFSIAPDVFANELADIREALKAQKPEEEQRG